MQTLTEIRRLLQGKNLRPQKQFGQNFLIDQNLMHKLLELAELSGEETVLEIGAATGSLTEELLDRAKQVVAVEIDRGLIKILQQQLGGRENLLLISGDVLADKHNISKEVIDALPPKVQLVANLPYNIAMPLIWQCLLDSWRAHVRKAPDARLFERLTFTIQQELAQKLSTAAGSKQYGPISVVVSLLGKITLGPAMPAEAFWPRPKVASRIVRIDFDAQAADKVADVDILTSVLNMMFAHRRKQLGWLLRRKDLPFSCEILAAAFDQAGIKTTQRAEQVKSETFLALANILAG